MPTVFYCPHCGTPIQVSRHAQSIRCNNCMAITYVADPPPSPHHRPLGPPPPAHGSKRAVICGISYWDTDSELEGCINDAKCMKYILVNRFHFPEASIIMLTEEETDPRRIPTRRNIMFAMHWLVRGCQRGDSLVFHYSGHGSQQSSDEEDDGYDETLCPLDYESEGEIVDDEINEIMVRPLPRGVKLHAFIDACHSGTVLDLPFLCRMSRTGRYEWEDQIPRSGMWKGTRGGEAICFSGCDDHQTSADNSVLSKNTSIGAMTAAFVQAIELGQGTTYGSILNSMRCTIRSTGNSMAGGPVPSILAMLSTRRSDLGGGLTQEPQLSSNEPFDVYRKPFSL